MKHINIAIDGPAGAGKSTIAKKVAEKREIIYVDTGAMYRAIGLYILRNHIEPDDVTTIERELEGVEVSLRYESGEQQVILNGENVTSLIRTGEVGSMASVISVHSNVRRKLVELQKSLAASTSVVMDGRDIGTVVLPNADVKIYLTASVEVRAQRRCKEMLAKGMECDFDAVKEEIAARDQRDMAREISPLTKAEDAIEIDTSAMNIDEVAETIDRLIRERIGK